jgi:hypothetical protein
MHDTTRWRSRFEVIDSISFTAEGLMRMHYFGTLFEILEGILKAQIGFVGAFVKSCEVLCVFGKAKPYSLIDQIGNRPIGVHGLETQRPMEIRIEIDCGSLLRCLHKNTSTRKRPGVNDSNWVLSTPLVALERPYQEETGSIQNQFDSNLMPKMVWSTKRVGPFAAPVSFERDVEQVDFHFLE